MLIAALIQAVITAPLRVVLGLITSVFQSAAMAPLRVVLGLITSVFQSEAAVPLRVVIGLIGSLVQAVAAAAQRLGLGAIGSLVQAVAAAPLRVGLGLTAGVVQAVASLQLRLGRGAKADRSQSVTTLSTPSGQAPELRRLNASRQVMRDTLAASKASKGRVRADLILILTRSIDHVDSQVTPTVQQVLERHNTLTARLAQYERGEIPVPEPGVLDRLRDIHARQASAIEQCLQQTSNAAAALVALHQDGNYAGFAAQTRNWAEGLLKQYDIIAETLRDQARQSELSVATPTPSRAAVARVAVDDRDQEVLEDQGDEEDQRDDRDEEEQRDDGGDGEEDEEG